MIGYCRSEECNLMVEVNRNKSDWQAMNNQAYSSRQIDKDSMPQLFGQSVISDAEYRAAQIAKTNRFRGFLGDYRLDAYLDDLESI